MFYFLEMLYIQNLQMKLLIAEKLFCAMYFSIIKDTIKESNLETFIEL